MENLITYLMSAEVNLPEYDRKIKLVISVEVNLHTPVIYDIIETLKKNHLGCIFERHYKWYQSKVQKLSSL